MIQLYRGHRIEVVRQEDLIYSHVERLRDGATVSEAEYPATWKVPEVLSDLKAALDLEMGALGDS